jgi:hypothetical protein
LASSNVVFQASLMVLLLYASFGDEKYEGQDDMEVITICIKEEGAEKLLLSSVKFH